MSEDGTVGVLVVGLGNMGRSHALAYARNPGFTIRGLVARHLGPQTELPAELEGYPRYGDYERALAELRPDAVCIASYTETHAPFALAALEAGCHVFVEKPLAPTVAEAEAVCRAARRRDRALVVGYILRHHPSWQRFVELGRRLGRPLVMRLNLNQRSAGETWKTHKALMRSTSPIVDCGVHYVDIMCQLTGARPVRVHAVGARLTDEIAPDMYNYGQLQVVFEDGSVGWYEAGWGPMMSEVAFFVKDVVGPRGCVSIVGRGEGGSDEIEGHTRTGALLLRHAGTDGEGRHLHADEWIDTGDEPDHQALCEREQSFFLAAIRGEVELSEHMQAAVDSLRIVLAADESIRSGRAVSLL